jgi:indolepyruvate ferredoxin oxidoreductase beta subunit
MRLKRRNTIIKKTSIILAGVGGQGILTAANILGKAALKAKKNVMISEVHGMAQRGGAVECMINIGDVHSSLIGNDSADVIISLEPVEALRHLPKIKKDSLVITDTNPVIPPSVSLGIDTYPDLQNIFEQIQTKCHLITIDALSIAIKSGARIAKNMVLLGALAETGLLPFSPQVLLEAIQENISSQFLDSSQKAFDSGRSFVKKKNYKK